LLKLARWGGLAAMVGGALFGVLTVVIASLPGGCIGEGCEFSQMKNTGFAVPLLMLALLFIAAGAAALVVHARQAGSLGKWGGVGAVIGAVGLALLVVGVVTGGLIEAFFFAGESPLMPLFVLPGALVLFAGLLLLVVAVLRANVLPRWTAVLLVLGLLTLLGFNEQSWRAVFGMPFGIAWVGVGYVLWTGRIAIAEYPSRVS
jgi:hypothetical protein